MTKADNDNELDTFEPLVFAHERLIEKLVCNDLTMNSASSDQVSSGSVPDMVKHTETSALPIDFDVRRPFVGSTLPSFERDTFNPEAGPNVFVGAIQLSGGHPQITNPIVGFVAVDVVEFVRQPSMDIKPCEAMSVEGHAANLESVVPMARRCTSQSTGVSPGPAIEPAGLRDVNQLCADLLGGYRLANSQGHLSDPHKEENGNGNSDADAEKGDDKRRRDHREAVDQRLRDLAAFERRYRLRKDRA
jgi:hypothetical protein